MDFRTIVELPKERTFVQHSDRNLFIGSCFSENIGKKFIDAKFRCDVNPFGVLYNPASIAVALTELMDGKIYHSDDEALVELDGWHSLHHHGSFSASSREMCVKQINERLRQSHEELKGTDNLFITFGTSWVYRWKANGMIVSNCHKFPSSSFARERMDVDQIVDLYVTLISRLLTEVNSKLRIIFTVSPIRHRKDGFHENQLSKSVLLLAVDALQKRYPHTIVYFPAYELLMDELRDYRFYADDMLHPSSLAVEYIWDSFQTCFFTDETKRILKDWNEIRKGLEHRPLHPESDAYRRFLCQIVLKLEQLKEKCPYFALQNELELCHTLLKQSQN